MEEVAVNGGFGRSPVRCGGGEARFTIVWRIKAQSCGLCGGVGGVRLRRRMAANHGDMYHLDGIAHVTGFIDDELTRCVRSIRRQQKMILHDRILPVLHANASEATVQIYARGYIMMLLSTAIFADKSGARVHLRWIPYVANLDGLSKYSWGSATLSWLCRVANQNVKNLAGPLALLQPIKGFMPFCGHLPRGGVGFCHHRIRRDPKSLQVATQHKLDRLSGDDFSWMPYNSFEVIQVVHPDILRPNHTLLWKSTTVLIYFASIE
ncbi:hypothetical protein Ahy_A08g038601 [Arachis hypogaea]|uniref:Aminotransferase-like plant mobile domain-containing protein n=1 Tax=Arachis hypogaea TaxID=3818 RepID=A0A445BTW2_ARAHY|nr:hypothetical protein Ahy_A08g038601 [Arachis hypogaea]